MRQKICKEQDQELSHGVYTHVSNRMFGKIRSPLDFLVQNYEHELTGKDIKLLDSGKKRKDIKTQYCVVTDVMRNPRGIE